MRRSRKSDSRGLLYIMVNMAAYSICYTDTATTSDMMMHVINCCCSFMRVWDLGLLSLPVFSFYILVRITMWQEAAKPARQ